ncbi:MAG: lysozyme [Acholeplasmataceae bacterium]|nr:lysozyme [Acholeplasmataceae bacterium]
MNKRASTTCIKLIKEFEGFRAVKYVCPAGKLTIGYGHTRWVDELSTVTEPFASYLLQADIIPIENHLNILLKGVELTQNQYDAIVSFSFNVGTTAFAFSTLFRLISKDPQDKNIPLEWRKWIHAGGKQMLGLIKRREKEIELYFKKDD